jgi:hypothetical protein
MAGDSVYLYPEDENYPHYIGRIVSAFVDEHSGHADPHCIQVRLILCTGKPSTTLLS